MIWKIKEHTNYEVEKLKSKFKLKKVNLGNIFKQY
jgi:hypothetical protein